MTPAIRTFLMFEGRAEEAMSFYVALLGGDSRIDDVARYGAEGPGAAGSVMKASFTLRGQSYLCIDSPVKHAFTFTPSISLFVDCTDETEIDRLFAGLSEGGKVLMPLDAYPFARKFGWAADRFGVSWQLILPPA